MANKLPKFWAREKSLTAIMLSPLAIIWAFQTRRRLAQKGVKLEVPVICVGNINMGGVGKTPTVIKLVEILTDLGHRPFVLTRGYGGSEKGPLLVKPEHRPERIGDEAIQLSMFAPVVVSRDRALGGKFCVQHGASIVIMDDGFQNPSLTKDLSIVVMDSDYGLGNGRIFPAGPLRESLATAKKRADAFLLIGKGTQAPILKNAIAPLPVCEGKLSPVNMGMTWTGKRLYAFAGIGRPEKFFQTLEDLGAYLVEMREFGDHEIIPAKLLLRMQAEAKDKGAQLITTEKDAARLPNDWQGKILSLPVRLTFEDDGFEAFIRQKLSDF